MEPEEPDPSQPWNASAQPPPRRILIIRLDKLGDTLLSLPLIDGLKACWPDCSLTCLVSPRGAPVFAADDRVDRLWEVDLSALSFTEKKALGRKIRSEAFDLVFCLKETTWPTIWTWMSNAPLSVGFDPGWRQPTKSFLRRLCFHRTFTCTTDRSRPSIHEVERYAALARLAGCGPADGPLRLSVPTETRAWAAAALAELELPEGTLPVALHLSEKWAGEGWSEDTAVAVAQALLDLHENIFLIVTAGPDDAALADRIAAELPAARFCLFSGLTVLEWGALLSLCRALVSMDTGAVHLAAAVNLPVVAAYPDEDFLLVSTRWAPWQVPHRIVRRPAPACSGRFYADLCAALEEFLCQSMFPA